MRGKGDYEIQKLDSRDFSESDVCVVFLFSFHRVHKRERS